MVGAIMAATFFTIMLVLILALIFLVKTTRIKIVKDAYEAYLSDNGYRQPTEDEIKEYYKKALKMLQK